MALSVYDAHVGLLQQIPFDTCHKKVLSRYHGEVACAHVKHAEIGSPDFARQLQRKFQ